jgi:carbamoylphosphate synthase small subunit
VGRRRHRRRRYPQAGAAPAQRRCARRVDHDPRRSTDDLVARARAFPDLGEIDLVAQVSTTEVVRWPGEGPRIAVLDCGAKRGIVQHLRNRGCEIVLFPYDATSS